MKVFPLYQSGEEFPILYIRALQSDFFSEYNIPRAFGWGIFPFIPCLIQEKNICTFGMM
jgi:hypothetical protein